MRKFYAQTAVLVFVIFVFASGAIHAQDFKIRQRTTIAGRSFESTVMIKGARERDESSGMGANSVTLIECDLKRTLKINDAAKTYSIMQMTDDSSDMTGDSSAASKSKSKKGFVTFTIEIVDTGERKQMFGLTARHVKTTYTIEPSPDACQTDKQKIEIDGWYADLSFGLTCQQDRPTLPPIVQAMNEGCHDQIRYVRKGTGKPGYPLQQTMKMSMDDDDEDESNSAMNAMSTMTIEVLEISRAALPQSLFEIPAGYKEVGTR